MGERFNASIRIGGALKEEDLEEFVEVLNDEGVGFDWVRDSDITEDDIRACLKDKEPLAFYDSEAAWGQFERLEKWLDEKKLPWIRKSDGYGEYTPEMVISMGENKFSLPTNTDGDPVVPMDEVEDALRMLREGRLTDALDRLKGCVKDIPELPPFEITP